MKPLSEPVATPLPTPSPVRAATGVGSSPASTEIIELKNPGALVAIPEDVVAVTPTPAAAVRGAPEKK